MNSIEKVWKKFLIDVLENGAKHEKDDGDKLYEHLINHAFIPNVVESILFNKEGLHLVSNDIFLKFVNYGFVIIERFCISQQILCCFFTKSL